MPTAFNDSIDGDFNDSCAVLSMAGKMNDQRNLISSGYEELLIDLIYRYKVDGGYLEDIEECYELDSM